MKRGLGKGNVDPAVRKDNMSLVSLSQEDAGWNAEDRDQLRVSSGPVSSMHLLRQM